MIIRLCEDTPKLAVRIAQPGCDGRQLVDTRVNIVIRPVVCVERSTTHTYWDGCSFREEVIPDPVPTLRYPAFELDDEGRVVFYFDDKLWSLPPGRYQADIEIDGDCVHTSMQIDLCNRPVAIEQVAVTAKASCGDASC